MPGCKKDVFDQEIGNKGKMYSDNIEWFPTSSLYQTNVNRVE